MIGHSSDDLVIATSGINNDIGFHVGLASTPQMVVENDRITFTENIIAENIFGSNLYMTEQGSFNNAGTNVYTGLKTAAIYSAGHDFENSALEISGFDVDEAYGMVCIPLSTTYGVVYIAFMNGGNDATMGSISINSSGNGVNYNTTSDYRLK